MSDSEDTKQCPNCKLDILPNNFTIHYVHCQRNFYLCSKCEQPVNFDKRDEHDDTNHVIVPCARCNTEFEKRYLDEHLTNDCPNRDQKCHICDIDVRGDELKEHEDYCGSRTEKCFGCGRFVMLKYKSLHLESNHVFVKLPDESGPSPSWQYGRRTLYNFLPDWSTISSRTAAIRRRRLNDPLRRSRNLAESYESQEDAEESDRRTLSFLFFDDYDEEDIDTLTRDNLEARYRRKSARDDLWPVLASLRSLQLSDEDQGNSTSSNESNGTQSNGDEGAAEGANAEEVLDEGKSSENKGKECSMEPIVLKNMFKPVTENELSEEKSVKKKKLENKTRKVKEQKKADMAKNDSSQAHDKQESVNLPCEFCGKLLLSSRLILHQNRCRSFMMKIDKMRSTAYRMLYLDDDMDKKIACGTCNKFFKLSLLENHQLQCQRNSSKVPKSQTCPKHQKSANVKSEPGLQNGLEPSSPKLSRMGTRSQCLSDMSRTEEGERDGIKKLNHTEPKAKGKTEEGTKTSKGKGKAPSAAKR